MKRRKALTQEHSLTLARIVTDLGFPAVIFVTLSDNVLLPQEPVAGLAEPGGTSGSYGVALRSRPS